MKIRQGFVSNSSSSSFVIVGFKIPYSFQNKIIEKAKELSEPELIPVRTCELCGNQPFSNWRKPTPKICDQCGGKLVHKMIENSNAYNIYWACEKLSLQCYDTKSSGFVAGIGILERTAEQAVETSKELMIMLQEKFPEEKFEIKLFGGEYPR